MTGRADMKLESDAGTVVAFLVLVTIAGGNAVAIRETSCEGCELDPFWSASVRFLLATLVFVVVARTMRAALPRGRALAGALLYGTLQFGAGFGLVYWGLVHAPAGLGQVLLACVPLLTFAFALAHHQERFRWEGLIGAASAVAGIAVIFLSGYDAGVPVSSMLAILAGAVCWAEALIVVKAFPPVHPAAMNAIAMGTGTVVLLIVTAVRGEEYALPASTSTWGALAYLVVAGSVGVFWLYLLVLRRWTASAASYQLVVIPLVTVVLSAWIHDERITGAFATGSVLVLLGVYVGVLRHRAASEGTRVTDHDS